MQTDYSELLLKTIAQIAPGTELREGLERILRGRTGALIVLGSDRTVTGLSSGGFTIDTEFSATRLRELAKMDGAIICDRDATRLLMAAVQLMPDATIDTNESGTRHRTAERMAIQTGFPVISVSASMSVISVYVDGTRYTVEDTQYLMARANQAIQTLESYKKRLNKVLSTLSALEIESHVTLSDVAITLQRMEMVRRIISEVSHYVLELGVNGRLVALQLEELRSPRYGGYRRYSARLPAATHRAKHLHRNSGSAQPYRHGYCGPHYDRPGRRVRRLRTRHSPAAARLPPA